MGSQSKPGFPRQKKQRKFVKVSRVNNEAQIFDIVDLVAVVFNVSQIQIVEKIGRVFVYKKQHLKMLQMTSHLYYSVARLM